MFSPFASSIWGTDLQKSLNCAGKLGGERGSAGDALGDPCWGLLWGRVIEVGGGGGEDLRLWPAEGRGSNGLPGGWVGFRARVVPGCAPTGFTLTGCAPKSSCQRDPANGLCSNGLPPAGWAPKSWATTSSPSASGVSAHGLGADKLPPTGWATTGSRGRAGCRRAPVSGLCIDGLPPAGWATPDSRRRARCGRAPSNGLCVGEFPPTGDGAPALSPPNSDRQEAWGSAG